MNWTEGNLTRASRGRKWNKTVARQKEHFAKSKLARRGRNSPISISFLPFKIDPHELTKPSRGSSSSFPSSPPVPRQNTSNATREIFGNTRGMTTASQARPLQHNRGLFSRTQNHNATETSRLPFRGDQDADMEAKAARLLTNHDWVGLNLQKGVVNTYPQARGAVSPLRTSVNKNRASNETASRFFEPISSSENRYVTSNTHRQTRQGPQWKDMRIEIGSQVGRIISTPRQKLHTLRGRPAFACESSPPSHMRYPPSQGSTHPNASRIGRQYSEVNTIYDISKRSRKKRRMPNCYNPSSIAAEYANVDTNPAATASTILLRHSQAPIQQPTPRRLDRPLVLDRRSVPASDMNDSVAVQPNTPPSALASSVVQEINGWKTFLAMTPRLDRKVSEKFSTRSSYLSKDVLQPNQQYSQTIESRRTAPPGVETRCHSINDKNRSLEEDLGLGADVATQTDKTWPEGAVPLFNSSDSLSRHPALAPLPPFSTSADSREDSDQSFSAVVPQDFISHRRKNAADCGLASKFGQEELLFNDAVLSCERPPGNTSVTRRRSNESKHPSKEIKDDTNVRCDSHAQNLVKATVMRHQSAKSKMNNANDDEDEAWKSFVFGVDTDDAKHAAFEVAKREVARQLVPSDDPASMRNEPPTSATSLLDSSSSLLDPPFEDRNNVITEAPPKLHACLSDRRGEPRYIDDAPDALSDDSFGTLSDYRSILAVMDSDDSNRFTAPSHILQTDRVITGHALDGHSATLQTQALTSEGEATSNAAQYGPSSEPLSENEHKFSRPKLFEGRFAGSSAHVPAPPVTNRGKGRGRQRGGRGSARGRGRGRGRAASSGNRTDIRGLPDFDGDPIEDSSPRRPG